MSQKQHKAVRQEYIAKVRYTNNLPPPPLNPKFLQYNLTEKVSSKKECEQLMTSLFRKENFANLLEKIDEEYGMNLNLINNDGFLDSGDQKSIMSLNQSDNSILLHPHDSVLLRDAGIGKITKSDPGVSFLRRTEYISERQLPKSSGSNLNQVEGLKKREHHDPEAQLKAVEETFERAQDTLDNFKDLKHPRKKNLKAVAAWPLLPDTSFMDTKFLSIKFLGSASISRETQALRAKQKDEFNEELQNESLSTAVFKPITSEDGEWMSMYKAEDKEEVTRLKRKVNSAEIEHPVSLLDEEQEQEAFKLAHYKNYDMNYNKFNKPYEELAIKFVTSGEGESKKRKLAVYNPVSGRIELKKHRLVANTEINKFLNDSTYDQVMLKIREPNTNEMKRRDVMRSAYDPMEYEGEEEEIGAEDHDQKWQEKEGEVKDEGEEAKPDTEEQVTNGDVSTIKTETNEVGSEAERE